MNRKHLSLLFLSALLTYFPLSGQIKVEKWKVFEVIIKGPSTGNPFTDVQLSADFTQGDQKVTVDGFYDGRGIYRIRFMPGSEGAWNYITSSNIKSLSNKKGRLICTSAMPGNHGQVVVKDSLYFAYADGTPHHSFGTTSYAWVLQGDSLANITLRTLAKGYFNKLRMCIFPKSYNYNTNEPQLYPFEGKPLTEWDFTRFNPAYFQNIEKRIRQLDSLGIEADLIVFHPYDRWGFSKMGTDNDNRYVKYIIARFAAFKNVWWSMANEYDLIKPGKNWEEIIRLFADKDPYQHLRSIHHCVKMYDHRNPLLTHVSTQSDRTYEARELRIKYRKPVIYDECKYEGNIFLSWGCLTPQAMVDKFWQGVVNGAYVGHSECYTNEQPFGYAKESKSVLWWSHGGELKGQSPERIKFLQTIIQQAPAELSPAKIWNEGGVDYGCVKSKEDYYLVYFPITCQLRGAELKLPAQNKYTIEIIDTWNMTIQKLPTLYSGKCLIELPANKVVALRIVKV